MTSVLCLRPKVDFSRVDALPPPSLSVRYHSPNDPEVPDLLRQSAALVIPAVGPKLAPVMFEDAGLKLIQVTGAGLDRLDMAAMNRLGIPVANVPGGSNSALAEYTLTAASILLRRFLWANGEIKRGKYQALRARLVADNLAGINGLLIGIVGLGTIGLAVAKAFAQAGCRICYHDPVPADPAAAQSIAAEALSLDALLARADVVTLHVPLLPATTGLIGAAQLEMMKEGAVLIQASRGGVVDEAALAQSLRCGHLGGAAVDVYSTEPPPADNPLIMLNGEAAQRLLLTPHIAGITRQSWAFLFRTAWENVERVIVKGAPPLYRAN
jgi:phosphoglycerate dehydrogenase-like enzyme